MSKPITEYIAENIETAINAITEANGFNQDLTAVRRKRIDFKDITPKDGLVAIMQAGDEKPEQPVSAADWIQKFFLAAFVIDSDKASDSIETRWAKVRDDIRKKLNEDIRRGDYALDTIHIAAMPLDDDEFTGILMELDVYYRTQFADPYTQG